MKDIGIKSVQIVNIFIRRVVDELIYGQLNNITWLGMIPWYFGRQECIRFLCWLDEDAPHFINHVNTFEMSVVLCSNSLSFSPPFYNLNVKKFARIFFEDSCVGFQFWRISVFVNVKTGFWFKTIISARPEHQFLWFFLWAFDRICLVITL